MWHSTDKYRRTIWQCNNMFSGDEKCTTPHLYEEDIKRLFMQAISELYADRKVLEDTCKLTITELTDTAEVDSRLAELSADMDVLKGRIERLIADQAVAGESDFNNCYTALADKYEALQKEYDKNESLRADRVSKRAALEAFLSEIRSTDTIPVEFSDRLWLNHIDHATVHSDGRIIFIFKNGREIAEKL